MANVGDEIVENKLRKNEMETFLKLLEPKFLLYLKFQFFYSNAEEGRRRRRTNAPSQ